jgi:hypothetical protein
MGVDGGALLKELKALRRGRGVNSVDISKDIGPLLQALCGSTPDDEPAALRRKVVQQLNRWASQLPEDLAQAVRAAVGLHPEARHRFLGERTAWLADLLTCDTRTVRRRMDEGLQLMAEQGAAQDHVGPPVEPATEEYYIAEYWALLRLDQPAPETHERRVIVSNIDGLAEIDALFTLPRDPLTRSGDHQLHMEVLYGVTLVDQVRETDSRFRYRLRLPSPLPAGQPHEYGLLYRIPPKQLMRTHYVFTSHRRCDAFQLRIRFDTDRVPSGVWRVDRGYPRDLDDGPAGDEITLDSAGELHLAFIGLARGMGYGARWRVGVGYQLEYATTAAEA